MLDDRYTTETSIWIVLIPMLISVYIATLLFVAVISNLIDSFVFNHVSSASRELYIYCSIFIGFLFSSFCIAISTYIAVPVYKKILMVVVFFIPIIWPNIISLFLFGINNTNNNFSFTSFNTELILFVSGSILGGFIAYNLVAKIESKI